MPSQIRFLQFLQTPYLPLLYASQPQNDRLYSRNNYWLNLRPHLQRLHRQCSFLVGGRFFIYSSNGSFFISFISNLRNPIKTHYFIIFYDANTFNQQQICTNRQLLWFIICLSFLINIQTTNNPTRPRQTPAYLYCFWHDPMGLFIGSQAHLRLSALRHM